MSLMEHWPDQSDWNDHLQSWFDSETARELSDFVDQQRQDETVFPPTDSVFNAFRLTSWSNTKVVILGQDPYHGPGQAHGLSFSVGESAERFPPSLRNIFKELASDLGCPIPQTSNLEPWARQGVLLLNTVLTVRSGEAHAHKNRGWESFTDAVIESFNSHAAKIVFVLWGKSAQKKATLIDGRHIQLVAPHPSPLSAHRGFFGSRPFSKINEMLAGQGREPIDWMLE